MHKAGGLLAVGAHGEVSGLGVHYEMEAYAMGGGLTPGEYADLERFSINSNRSP